MQHARQSLSLVDWYTIGGMTMPFFAMAYLLTACWLAGEVKKAESLKMQSSVLNGASEGDRASTST